MHFAIIVLIVYLVLSLSHYALTRSKQKALCNIPGPYCVPLFGAILGVLGLNQRNFLQKGEEHFDRYGMIMKAWVLNRFFVFSADAELNEQILSSTVHITKHRSYSILHNWLGTGLLMSSGKKWHSRRKIITPAFHFKILESFLEVFEQQSSILVERLAEKADGKTVFNIYPYMCAAALDIIAETAMGTKVNAQTDETMEYTAAVNEMMDLTIWRMIRLHLSNEFIFTLLHPNKKLRQTKLINIMHEFTQNVITEKRKSLPKPNVESPNNTNEDQDQFGIKKRMAFLDILLKSTVDGQPLSDEDIREEVDTFMFEGHDTTSAALSFMLHVLSRHSRVQQKMLAEIQQVFDDDNASMTLTLMKLNELKYMECVIKESLRLFPPVPIIGREIEEDFKYKHSSLGDGVIPAGTEFIIAIVGSLRDRNKFEDREDFIPERHENIDIKNTFNFIPFSAGPRNCVGQKFAMYEMKVILLKIVREYELLPLGEEVEVTVNIVLRSLNGMQLGMRKRLLT